MRLSWSSERHAPRLKRGPRTRGPHGERAAAAAGLAGLGLRPSQPRASAARAGAHHAAAAALGAPSAPLPFLQGPAGKRQPARCCHTGRGRAWDSEGRWVHAGASKSFLPFATSKKKFRDSKLGTYPAPGQSLRQLELGAMVTLGQWRTSSYLQKRPLRSCFEVMGSGHWAPASGCPGPQSPYSPVRQRSLCRAVPRMLEDA